MELGNILAVGCVLLSLLIIYTKGMRRYLIYKQKRNERRSKQKAEFDSGGNTRPK